MDPRRIPTRPGEMSANEMRSLRRGLSTIRRVGAMGGAGAIARKRIVAIEGDGTTTTFSANHGLGSQTVIVQVIDESGATVDAAATRTDANEVELTFDSAPANGAQLRVIVIG